MIDYGDEDTLKNLFPTYKFRVNEISMGVYRVTCTDSLGRIVIHHGTDPEQLVKQCITSAESLSS